MKKFMICIITVMLLLTSVPLQLKAGAETDPASTKTAESAQAKALLNRLDEIKAMDKTTLSSSEKRLLRKEVRMIKSDLKELSGGVYVSVGAIIIILLAVDPFTLKK